MQAGQVKIVLGANPDLLRCLWGVANLLDARCFAPHPKPLPQNEGGASKLTESLKNSPSLVLGEGAGDGDLVIISTKFDTPASVL